MSGKYFVPPQSKDNDSKIMRCPIKLGMTTQWLSLLLPYEKAGKNKPFTRHSHESGIMLIIL
jgi:hypothetical protein